VNTVKGIVLVAVLVFGFTGIAGAAGLSLEKTNGDETIRVTFGVETIPLDEVDVSVGVYDADGKAITDAKVRIYYGMAAMPGMPPMDYKTKAELNGEVYEARVEFSMAGPWYLEVKYKRPGVEGISKARFNVDAH